MLKIRAYRLGKCCGGSVNTSGSRNLTKPQYQSVRILAATFSENVSSSWKKETRALRNVLELGRIHSLPHFSTLRKHYRPLLLNTLAPRGIVVDAAVDTSKAGARNHVSSLSDVPLEKVIVILPSEYARADMSTPPVWDLFVKNSLSALPASSSRKETPNVCTSECPDLWPLVAARGWFYGKQKALYVDGAWNGSAQYAEAGDVLQCTLLRRSSGLLSERLSRCFQVDDSSTAQATLQGVILHAWNVHHSIRRGDALFEEDPPLHLSPADRQLVASFNFVSYTSPADAVHVEIPNVPTEVEINMAEGEYDALPTSVVRSNLRTPEAVEALKARRAALKRRKVQMETAWRNWTKPVLKPGDFIVMLRPCSPEEHAEGPADSRRPLLTSVDKSSRLFIVSRFWTENEERSRHAFWIDGGTTLEAQRAIASSIQSISDNYCSAMFSTSPRIVLIEIQRLTVSKMHHGRRGVDQYTPVSSIGTLLNDENYFIYRFLIFWDGFEIARGKSSSGEGVLSSLSKPSDYSSLLSKCYSNTKCDTSWCFRECCL